jgi:hypothetical protein
MTGVVAGDLAAPARGAGVVGFSLFFLRLRFDVAVVYFGEVGGVAGVRALSAVDDMLRDAESSSREEEAGGAKLERSLEAEAAGTIAAGAAVGFWRDDDDFGKETDGVVVVRADSVDDMLRDAEGSSREEGSGAKLERSSVESVRVTAAGFGGCVRDERDVIFLDVWLWWGS